MAEYVRIFVIDNIDAIHAAFLRLRREVVTTNARDRAARRRPTALNTQAELELLYAKFNRDLDRAASTSAARATRAIKSRIEQTRVRPETDKPRHLADMVKSRRAHIVRGVATGAVGIADVAELNKAIDPDFPSGGTYWEAQEYGTFAHMGRRITGYFYGGDAPIAPPREAQFRVHSAFSPEGLLTGPRGGRGGRGTIRRPLMARRFIRDGADDEFGRWRAAVEAAEREFMQGLRHAAPRRGRVTTRS